jgi:hypothetical protein
MGLAVDCAWAIAPSTMHAVNNNGLTVHVFRLGQRVTYLILDEADRMLDMGCVRNARSFVAPPRVVAPARVVAPTRVVARVRAARADGGLGSRPPIRTREATASQAARGAGRATCWPCLGSRRKSRSYV